MKMRCLIGIIANDAARFSEFWSCVLRLKVPEGSTKDQVIGGDWCSARNELAQRCLDEGYDYLWFMDDDHSFAPDLLQRLLDAAVSYDLPIVNPLCTTRTAPFHLVTFAANPDPDSTDRYLPISLEGIPGEGIIELEAGGCAGMLIRRDVLEATRIQYPGIPGEAGYQMVEGQWFEYTDRSEDITFCEKAKAAGFKIYADLSCRLGHITTAVVMPGIVEDKWVTGLTVGRDFQVMIPTAEELLRQQELEWVEESSEPELPETESLVEMQRRLTEVAVADALESTFPPAVEPVAVQHPCLICGKEAAWTDANGIWACEDHPGDHEIWKTYYERFEIWYVLEKGRWFGRGLNMAGQVVTTALTGRSWTQELPLVSEIESSFPNIPIFHIQDEMESSRNSSPPYGSIGRAGKLWARDPI